MTSSPPVLETAPTGRAKCRACGQAIAKGAVRLGERVPNLFADGDDVETTYWYHPVCASFRRPEVMLDVLQRPDVEIQNRAQLEAEAAIGVAHRRTVRVDAAGRAPSGRALCRACKAAIAKDSWRIGLVFYDDGRFAPSGFIHATCAAGYFETSALLPRLRHFSSTLGHADLAEIEALLLSTS